MPNLSPQQPPVSTTVPSPRPAALHPARPGLLKRHSSTSTPGSNRAMASNAVSPGSHPDSTQPLRHQVRGKHNHHARLVVPRGHGSRTNLAKMGGGRQQGNEGRERHGRQRSHEGDTEIRLPGSLDESAASSRMESVARPQMKRNLTAYQLPRNLSHGKLKKNLSHGQLQRLGSKAGGLTVGGTQQQQQQRPPGSPGLRGKSKSRPKSADFGRLEAEQEVDLHEQEVELARRMKEGKGKGFRLGSLGDEDSSEEEEEEWTEESASASPYSTRQNTANNSRRASVARERSGLVGASPVKVEPLKVQHAKPDEEEAQRAPVQPQVQTQPRVQSQAQVQVQPQMVVQPHSEEEKEEDADEDEDQDQGQDDDDDDEEDESESEPASPRSQPHAQPVPDAHTLKPVSSAKEHTNPTTSFLRRQSEQHIAPAQVSNITATDTAHSNTPSTKSQTSSASQQQRPTVIQRDEVHDDAEQTEELISRFIPSTSQPQSVPHSTPTTNAPNTPAQSMFHQPSNPTSPGGSTLSASSGAATPSAASMKGRSRIELKMMSEKALADLEETRNVGRQPTIPAHVYDRRNESLKSYLNLATLGMGGPDIRPGAPVSQFHSPGAQSGSGMPGISPSQIGTMTPASGSLSLGPETFQGRFNAVQQELRVVQKFRDPLRDSIARLRNCAGSKLNSAAGKAPTKGLKGSRSAVSLPLRSASHGASKSASQLPAPAELDGAADHARPVVKPKRQSQLQLSTSASPPRTALKSPGLQASGGPAGQKRVPSRGVSFAGGEPAVISQAGLGEAEGVEEIARRLWEGVGL